jgi:lincosamide nucleotidyltransferase A/C/D/E
MHEVIRGAKTMPGMTAANVIEFLAKMETLGIQIWIIGGWGVDALLGEQTRPHDDLDIVIQWKDVERACEYLEGRSFRNVPRPDTSTWNFVLGDSLGHEIDFHVIVFDEEGNGIYGPTERGVIYPPAGSLWDDGSIMGHRVRCISPEQMVKDHIGYKVRERDFQDVSALCEKFGIAIPEEYRC